MKALKNGSIKATLKRGLKKGYFRGSENRPKMTIRSKKFIIGE